MLTEAADVFQRKSSLAQLVQRNGGDCGRCGLAAHGSCAHYTRGPPPIVSTSTGIPKTAANGVPSEASSLLPPLARYVLHQSHKCPLQSVNRKWKTDESGWKCLEATWTHKLEKVSQYQACLMLKTHLDAATICI